MIPTEEQSKALWIKYNLPEKKRIHVLWISKLAGYLARELQKNNKGPIDESLLIAGCLLHDIDKNIPRLSGESHPQTGVRVLKEEGLDEVASLIQYHSVQYIEDPVTAPKSWEEKLLFLSDKMVKQEIIGVDERFAQWFAEEDLPLDQKEMLKRVYPKVKALETEIFSYIHINPEEVAKLIETT